MKGVSVVGKLLKKISNSNKEMLEKRIQNLNDSDLGVHDFGDGNYEVYNFDNKTLYRVVYVKRYAKCDCSDYVNRCEECGIPCKHILAVHRYVKSEPDVISKGFENFLENVMNRKELVTI